MRANVLYLTRNGLLEPLGQSQILPYLLRLSDDFALRVVSFEKPADLAVPKAQKTLARLLAAHGVFWTAHRFQLRPRRVAPAIGIIQLIGNAFVGPRPHLVHARSYVPAAVALLLKRIFGTPFIFDMRALWVEELLLSGEIAHGSRFHQSLLRVERECLREAAGIVSLTEAAVGHLREIYPAELAGKEIAVIPTCTDLDRFVPSGHGSERPMLFGCSGTVLSAWFRIDWLATLFRVAARRDPDARFEILTRDDPKAVREAIGGGECLQRRLDVRPLPSSEMPDAVRRHSVSVMFFRGGLAKLGSSPTRLGEALGSGVPVLANDGVGDVGKILHNNPIGVLMEGGSEAAAERALDELDRLLACPETPNRCRAAAEAIYSLESGARAYRTLYRRILGQAGPAPAPARAPVAATGAQD